MKVKLSWVIAHSADSPVPPQNNCFLQQKPCPSNMCAKHVLPMGWALPSRVIFNKLNIYCHIWHKEYKYFVFDEITTVNWQQEKSPIFCIVTASIIFVAKMAFVLQRAGSLRGAPGGKAFLRGESHFPPELSGLYCQLAGERHTT